MSRNLISIAGIPIELQSRPEIMESLCGWLLSPEKSYQVITLNAIMMITAIQRPDFKAVLQKADLMIIDGYGIVWLLQKKGFRQIPHLSGVELIREIIAWCSIHQRSIYCYGGTAKVVASLKRVLLQKWPQLHLCGLQDGYQNSLAQDEVIRDILKKQPHLLLVGLGTPEQELFLANILPLLPGTIGIGVGGSFEVLAGMKREAPKFFRDHGWEWLFRMMQDPLKFRLLPKLVYFWYWFILKSDNR